MLELDKKISWVVNFAILNIKTRYQSTYLGIVWAALEPLLYFSILYVVFSSIRVTGEDFAIYLITGVMFFHIFTRGTSGGLNSLTSNSGIIKSINTNKIFFPIVATFATLILAIVDVSVFFILMPIFQFVPNWTILLLPIPIVLLFLLILGVSYFLSVVNVMVRDIQYLWIIITHSLLFISPIFWKISDVNEGVLLTIQQINPLGQVIELTHKIVLDGTIPSIDEWLYTTGIIVGIFLFGYFVFHKLEKRITERL